MYVMIMNSNMPDYFRSSTDRKADKRERKLIMQRIHNEFSDVCKEWDVLMAKKPSSRPLCPWVWMRSQNDATALS